jgi:hypothetical protein
LFIAFSCAALGYIFLAERFSLLVFIFFLAVAIGLVFLLWGSFTGKLGLIIPGALLIAIGAGVYYGWSNPDQPGGLQETGIMLVWFALGWLLITVFFSRDEETIYLVAINTRWNSSDGRFRFIHWGKPRKRDGFSEQYRVHWSHSGWRLSNISEIWYETVRF